VPPPVVKSIRDLIFWQYAKIISESAGAGKRQYGFVMDRFKKLTSEEISWSTSIREYVKEREKAEEGATARLSYCKEKTVREFSAISLKKCRIYVEI